jgi:poly-beta-hydroxyalkanoate depolymerase
MSNSFPLQNTLNSGSSISVASDVMKKQGVDIGEPHPSSALQPSANEKERVHDPSPQVLIIIPISIHHLLLLLGTVRQK